MESMNVRVEAQQEPAPQHDDGPAPMPSINFARDGERRSLRVSPAVPESGFVGTSCSKKHISIAAAAAHARTTTFIILAIGAAIYLLLDPVSS